MLQQFYRFKLLLCAFQILLFFLRFTNADLELNSKQTANLKPQITNPKSSDTLALL